MFLFFFSTLDSLRHTRKESIHRTLPGPSCSGLQTVSILAHFYDFWTPRTTLHGHLIWTFGHFFLFGRCISHGLPNLSAGSLPPSNALFNGAGSLPFEGQRFTFLMSTSSNKTAGRTVILRFGMPVFTHLARQGPLLAFSSLIVFFILGLGFSISFHFSCAL